jgi:hypothetical protein
MERVGGKNRYLRLSLVKAVLCGFVVACLAGCGGGGPKTVSVSIAAPSSTTLDAGGSVTLSATVKNDPANQGVNWSLGGSNCSGATCGSLGNSSSTSVTYKAPSSVTTGFTATITATSISKSTATATQSLTIAVSPSISTAAGALAAGTVGSAYSATLTGTGGVTPYSWAVTTGSLPAGLTLGASSGTISGTPTTAGNSSFTVTLTDSGSLTATANYTIAVSTAPLQITTSSITNGTVGTAYSQVFAASGGSGNYSWSLTAGASALTTLGLTLSSGGTLSGTPTTAGSYPFTVQVTDTSNQSTQTASFTLVVSSVAASTCTHDGSANALLNGNYAFVLSGFDPSGNTYDVVGDFKANGTGTISSGNADANSTAFTGAEQQYTFTGTYSVGDSANDNRGTTTWSNTNTSGTTLPSSTTYCFAADAITGGVAYSGWMVEADGSGFMLTGYYEIQNPTYFVPATLNTGYVFGLHGVGSSTPANRSTAAGVIDFNGSGGISGGQADLATYDNSTQSTTYQAKQSISSSGSSYTLASNGRGTATISTPSGNIEFVFYLIGTGQEFVTLSTGTGSGGVVTGTGLRQTTTSFTASDVTGSAVYRANGTTNPTTTPVGDDVRVGQYTFGSSSVAETYDENSGGTISLDQTASGTFTIASNGYLSLSGVSGNANFYLYSQDSGFGVDASNGAEFYYMEQQAAPSGGFTTAGLAGSTFSFGTIFPAAYNSSGSNSYPITEAGVVSFGSGGALTGTEDRVTAPGLTANLNLDSAITATYAIDSTNGSTTGRLIFSQAGTPVVVGYLVSPDIVFLIQVNSGQDSLILDGDAQQ